MAYSMYPQQFYQPMPQYLQSQQMQQQTQPQMQPQMQNGGFVSVPNEEAVYSYPIASGNCITFKIEGKPIVMEKSMGFSQLESPRIERYRLVKEDSVDKVEETPKEEVSYTLQSEFDALQSEVNKLRTDVNKLMSVKKVKKEVIIEDDDE